MGGKGPDTHTTTTSTEPPEYIRPYIERGLQRAETAYTNQPLYSSMQLPDAAQTGFDSAIGAALDPRLTDPAIDLAGRTLGGEFLGADALRNAARAELDDVIGGTQSQFELAGRTGSPAAMNALGRGVTTALSGVYDSERARQQQAMGLAGSLEAMRYAPGMQAAQMAMQQRGIEDRYYQEPWDRLARYVGIGLGNAPAQLAGGIQTNQQPIYQPSPLQQGLGLGLTAASMFL